MHLPDGSLSPTVWLTGNAVAAGVLIVASKKAKNALSDRQVPLMGVLGAFVFAAQMINFPLPGGTSGHLIGAVLLTVLLGPAVSSLVMFCVLLVQALIFQDGGITVLGANFINMALCGTLLGWLLFRALNQGQTNPPRFYLAVFVACFLSVEIGALACALQLWCSDNAPLVPALIAMGSVHAVIGLAEGLITVATLRFLFAARPELIREAA